MEEVAEDFSGKTLKVIKKTINKKETNYVSVKAWDRAISDFEAKLNDFDKRINSQANQDAFNKVVKDFEQRISKIETSLATPKDMFNVNELIKKFEMLKVDFESLKHKMIEVNTFLKSAMVSEAELRRLLED